MYKKNALINQCWLFIFLLFFKINSSVATALPKAYWPIWVINNPQSKQHISHQQWQKFLDHTVISNEEQINVIDYAHLTPNDRQLLQRYIKNMSEVNIDQYNRKEQLAYWLNLYNALTVQTIANYYPIATIREISTSPGLFSIGPWGAHLINVKNIPLSLDDINNRIIRPIWNDQRTLYALNNSTMGAANLNKFAFTSTYLDTQLNKAATTYINSLRGVQVIEGRLIISKIYDWYEGDFGGTKQDVIQHITFFAQEPLRSQLKHINTIDSYMYNWHLNSPPLSNN